MKRALLLLMVLLAGTAAFADVDFATFQDGFNTFAQDLSNGLPFNTSVGLGWSPAYIGQFPHFGIGVTVGATTIPYKALKDVFDALGVTLPANLNFIAQYGVPIPAYTIDARIGGFFLPFDIGLKFGYLPPGALQGQSFTADYLLVGGDLRYAVLQDKGFVPAISVGLGYNYMKGGIGVPGLLSGNIQIADFVDPRDNSKHTLELSNPSLGMQWSASVLEAKVQISKKILFITPYLGAAVSYSFGAEAGGGLTASLLYDGATPTASQLALINQAYGGSVNITDQSITVLKTSNPGFDYRAFGGLSLDIFFVYLDIGAAYDFSTSALGASANLRIAF
jgi:hypothetical protein